MTESLRHKTARGMLWSGVQRVSAISITVVSNIVLARILSPDDFGAVGMLMVFITMSATLVDGGLGSALIQKRVPTQADYSTVFYFNLTLSLLLYAALLLAAPSIASFYKLEQLAEMLRVLGIVVVIDALAIVQTNQLVKQLEFRRLMTINVVPSLAATVVAIALAVAGFGVWSLVVRSLVQAFLRSFLAWATSGWRPQRRFEAGALRGLMGFGGLVFLSNASETAVTQLVSLLIGSSYSARDLGYYTQANTIHQVPQRTIPFVVNQVLFPVFSSMQENMRTVAAAIRKSLNALCFASFPLMVALMLVAKPMIVVLFTDKWLPSVPYFQVLCLGGMVYSANACNVTVLTALGQGRTLLYVSLVKRGITFLSILIGMQFGVFGIVWGWVVSVYIWFPINAISAGRLTAYGLAAQVRDIGPTYLTALLIGAVVAVGSPRAGIRDEYLLAVVQLGVYASLYAAAVWTIRPHEFTGYVRLLREVAWRGPRRKPAPDPLGT